MATNASEGQTLSRVNKTYSLVVVSIPSGTPVAGGYDSFYETGDNPANEVYVTPGTLLRKTPQNGLTTQVVMFRTPTGSSDLLVLSKTFNGWEGLSITIESSTVAPEDSVTVSGTPPTSTGNRADLKTSGGGEPLGISNPRIDKDARSIPQSSTVVITATVLDGNNNPVTDARVVATFGRMRAVLTHTGNGVYSGSMNVPSTLNIYAVVVYATRGTENFGSMPFTARLVTP